MDGLNFTRTVGNKLAPMILNSGRLDGLVTTHDTEMNGVPVRLYEPWVPQAKVKKQKLQPGLVYYHGGGWTIGSVGKQIQKCCLHS